MSAPKDPRLSLGKRAEAKAQAHLEAAGLKLVAKNWKASARSGFGGHGGELDLVMKDGDVLVFVEVRSTSAFATHRRGFGGGAIYSVGHAKQRRLASLAQLFIYGMPTRPRMRFDVVALTRTLDCTWEIRWYKNAFGV